LPPMLTSVARMTPSGRERQQPYTTSNMDWVTQPFTLKAEKAVHAGGGLPGDALALGGRARALGLDSRDGPSKSCRMP
jgi:hypothetical protein